MSSTNAMNFGPAWYDSDISDCPESMANTWCRMRGDATRSRQPGAPGLGGDTDGHHSPHIVSNGPSPLSPPPTSDPATLHPGVNGTSTSLPHGRTNSYSSILTSAQSNQSANDSVSGNGPSSHDKPFKYSRDEMLSIWKNNAQRIKNNGIPLEFERHDTFTSENTLDPVLLTEMSSAEKEVSFHSRIEADVGVFWILEF